MKIKIHPTETFLFLLKVLASILILIGLFALAGKLLALESLTTVSTFAVFIVYAFFIWLFVLFQKVYIIAYLKGNGIEITEHQFPEINISYRELTQGSLKFDSAP